MRNSHFCVLILSCPKTPRHVGMHQSTNIGTLGIHAQILDIRLEEALQCCWDLETRRSEVFQFPNFISWLLVRMSPSGLISVNV